MSRIIAADEAKALLDGTTPGPWATYDLMGPRSTSGVCTDATVADGRPVVIARGMSAAELEAQIAAAAPTLQLESIRSGRMRCESCDRLVVGGCMTCGRCRSCTCVCDDDDAQEGGA